MNYFEKCISVNDVKKRYKNLAKRLHPDLGGSDEQMKALNAQYEKCLENRNGSTVRGTDGINREYKFDAAKERDIMEKLAELYSKRLGDNVEIALAGTWLWITGDTKAVKEKIKECGFRFAPLKKAWSWHPGTYHRRHGKTYSMDEIARAHGFVVMSQPREARLNG